MSVRRLWLPVALCVGALLYLGLTPKDFRIANDATWLEDGLRFAGSGIAYARPRDVPRGGAFSIDLALDSGRPPAEGYNIVLVLHDGSDEAQLAIGQWRSFLIILNGDDYDYKRRLPRVTVDLRDLNSQPTIITLSSGDAGTRLYADGTIAAEIADTHLRIPAGQDDTPRLILGNSPSLRNGWTGTVYGIAIRDHETSPVEALEISKAWPREAEGLRPASPTALVAVADGQPLELTVPTHIRVLQRSYLSIGFGVQGNTRALVYDVVINIVGFVPFGALVCALLLRKSSRRRALPGSPPAERSAGRSRQTGRGAVMAAGVTAGAALSLTIEVTQAWLPARHSSLLDLGLNILGTLIGSALAVATDSRRAAVAARRRMNESTVRGGA